MQLSAVAVYLHPLFVVSHALASLVPCVTLHTILNDVQRHEGGLGVARRRHEHHPQGLAACLPQGGAGRSGHSTGQGEEEEEGKRRGEG